MKRVGSGTLVRLRRGECLPAALGEYGIRHGACGFTTESTTSVVESATSSRRVFACAAGTVISVVGCE